MKVLQDSNRLIGTKKREFQYKQPEIVVQHVYASETTKPETVPNHMRSKSYESEYLNKAQNTFGLENAKKTKRQHSISHEDVGGFISPKFRFEDPIELSKVTEMSLNEDQKLLEKEKIIDDLQKELTQFSKNMQHRLEQLRNEKNAIINQQLKQIEIYEKTVQDCRNDSNLKQQEINKLKKRARELRQSIDQEKMLTSVPSTKCSCQILERENQALLGKVDQLRLQLSELKSQCDFNNSIYSLEQTHCNQISVIEKQCDITHFEKTFKLLADELNVNCSYSINNQEILDGVKYLKYHQRDNEKFIRCLRDLVLQCAPQDYFVDSNPPLKEVWKFIKNILQTYLENRKSATMNEDIIQTLTRYLGCDKVNLCHITACMIVDVEVYQKIVEKIRKLLNLGFINNIREIDRKLDQYI